MTDQPVYFQVRLDPGLSQDDYLLDVDAEALVRDVLLPKHAGGSIFIRGAARAAAVVTVRIIVTDRPVQPELKAWFQSKKGVLKPKEEFFAETRLFDIERDVTNAMFNRFREALEWRQIDALLAEAKAARTQYASAGSDTEKSSLGSRLRQISAEIAHLAGAFLGGYQRW